MPNLRSLTRPASLLSVLTLLTACAATEREAPEVRTVFITRPVAAAAKQPCNRPTVLRSGSAVELERALARDGVALLECEARRKAALEGAP